MRYDTYANLLNLKVTLEMTNQVIRSSSMNSEYVHSKLSNWIGNVKAINKWSSNATIHQSAMAPG